MAEDRSIEERELTLDEQKDLVKVLATATFPGARELLRQAASTSVAGGIPTLLNLTVDPSAPPAPVSNGPVPGRWVVESEAGELEGELLVWVKDGYLDGLEFAWVTDQPPPAFPTPDRVRPWTAPDGP